MIEIGKIQNLCAVRTSDFGMYLSIQEDETEEVVLLPNKQVPEGMEIGQQIQVFIYKDTEDRIIATTQIPSVTVGEVANLEVVEVTKIGAFLNWGLQKDLLLPFKEQLYPVSKGEHCLVSVYVDKSERLCATMKVYNSLQIPTEYKQNQTVKGLVYQVKPELGVFVAVDRKYHGLIPNQELFGQFKVGDEIETRVKKIRPDGKLELSTRRQAFQQIEVDAKKIMQALDAKGGKLPINDSSSPAQIKQAFNMSKASFKRAVGRLLKEGAIKLTGTGIERNW